MKIKQAIRQALLPLLCLLCCGSAKGQFRLSEAELQDSIAVYIEKVRQGDNEAYLRLALFHVLYDRNEERGLMNGFTLVALAEQRGHIRSTMLWAKELPSGTLGKLLYELLVKINKKEYDSVLQYADTLEQHSVPGELLKAAVCLDKQDKDGTIAACRTAIDKGSLLGKFMLMVATDDTSELHAMAEQVPFFYNEMARQVGKDKEVLSREENEAVKELYYKADKHGVLDAKGARWLVKYYEHLKNKYGIDTDPKEINRLRKLGTSQE